MKPEVAHRLFDAYVKGCSDAILYTHDQNSLVQAHSSCWNGFTVTNLVESEPSLMYRFVENYLTNYDFEAFVRSPDRPWAVVLDEEDVSTTVSLSCMHVILIRFLRIEEGKTLDEIKERPSYNIQVSPRPAWLDGFSETVQAYKKPPIPFNIFS